MMSINFDCSSYPFYLRDKFIDVADLTSNYCQWSGTNWIRYVDNQNSNLSFIHIMFVEKKKNF